MSSRSKQNRSRRRSGEWNANHERGSLLGRLEHEVPAVGVLDDPAGQREADPPAAALGGDTRLENVTANLAGNAGAVVTDAKTSMAVLRCRSENNGAAPAL